MIDFSILDIDETAEEIAANERRRKTNAVQSDTARRTECSEMTLIFRLNADAETDFTNPGAQTVRHHGSNLNDNQIIRATWFAPETFRRNHLDLLLTRLRANTDLRLDGYWAPITNSHGEKHFTFIAQFIRFEDGTSAP